MSPLLLPVVDANELPPGYIRALRPGEQVADREGGMHILPTQFLRIDTWQSALSTQMTPHFMLWELIGVDVREAPPLQSFPRYVPCAVLLLAQALELFRLEAGTYVHIAANGGYRSPAHALSRYASRHCWGTAANIYRVGDRFLDNRADIEEFGAIARRLLPGAWVRPYGHNDGCSDDHLHFDLGYAALEPVQEGVASITRM